MRRHCAPVLAFCAVTLIASAAAADVAWVGDFETADLSQWNYVLNGENDQGTPYIQVLGDEIAQGRYAARIELHNDAAWPNGLKRVELQHRPADERTAEGATTFFAWSFFLPDTLPADPGQTIGYWESNNSYQQVMAFQVAGESITFSTRRPDNVVQWQADGIATAGQWHRIAMRVLWSTDPATGEVDVWFDGQQVVDTASAQTLADNNAHFTQVGLLRAAIEFEDVPVIVLDHALEGDSLDDVAFDALPGGEPSDDSGTDDGGGDSTGFDPSDGDTTTDPPPPDDGAPDPDDGAATQAGSTSDPDATADTTSVAADDRDDENGCACTTSDRAHHAAWLALLMLAMTRRGRSRRSDALARRAASKCYLPRILY
jgi:hypothetical protein